jgi:hypothetical protein
VELILTFLPVPNDGVNRGDLGMGWSERWNIQRYGASLGEMRVNYELDVDKLSSFSPENLVKIWTFMIYTLSSDRKHRRTVLELPGCGVRLDCVTAT